jgi:nucleoside-diphosphate-sugar epimerase
MGKTASHREAGSRKPGFPIKRFAHAHRREFLHADDGGDAPIHLAEVYSGAAIVDVGTGDDLTICELAGTIGRVAGHPGEVVFDATR